MIFPYWELQRDYEVRLLPLVRIRTFNGDRSVQFDALVDSGAEHSVFSLEIADELGIHLGDARHVVVVGAGGHEIDGFLTRVELQLGRHRWTAPSIFSEAGSRRGILGQIGFFAFFSVTFRYDQREMDIRRNRRRA
jgi:hypothetical protein